MCFMNGLMIEHNWLGINCFSVDILKDMVVCWYAWVLMSTCQIIDYYFESFKSKCPCYKRKEYMMNMIGSIPQTKSVLNCYFIMISFMRKSCCYDARKSDWNYHWSKLCTLLAFTLHKNYFFYHLPTRGWVGIKLGDADTYPTYL